MELEKCGYEIKSLGVQTTFFSINPVRKQCCYNPKNITAFYLSCIHTYILNENISDIIKIHDEENQTKAILFLWKKFISIEGKEASFTNFIKITSCPFTLSEKIIKKSSQYTE